MNPHKCNKIPFAVIPLPSINTSSHGRLDKHFQDTTIDIHSVTVWRATHRSEKLPKIEVEFWGTDIITDALTVQASLEQALTVLMI